MSPDLKPGVRFEWQYRVPERATVPNLFNDTPFCRARLMEKKAKAGLA
jgi:fluoroacetyl-CoA thioesterase